MYGIDTKDLTEFYFDKKTKGCIFSVGKNIKKEHEFKGNLKMAEKLMKRGNMVELLERTNKNNVKSIDALVNNINTEFKGCSSKTSIDNGLRDAHNKCKNLKTRCNVVLDISKDFKGIENAISDRLRRSETIDDVYIFKGNKLYKWDKNTKGMRSIP